jgi:hypothetical protein
MISSIARIKATASIVPCRLADMATISLGTFRIRQAMPTFGRTNPGGDGDRQQLKARPENDRPRKRPGYHTPAEAFAKLLAEDQRVATTP